MGRYVRIDSTGKRVWAHLGASKSAETTFKNPNFTISNVYRAKRRQIACIDCAVASMRSFTKPKKNRHPSTSDEWRRCERCATNTPFGFG